MKSFQLGVLLAVLTTVLSISLYVSSLENSFSFDAPASHLPKISDLLTDKLSNSTILREPVAPRVNDETVCTSYNNNGLCSSTMKGGGRELSVQNDGNLVIYENGRAIWASHTSRGNGNFILKMQGDGNLVLYQRSWNRENPIWASNTNGRGAGPFAAVVNKDGNLAVYDSNKNITWNSRPNL